MIRSILLAVWLVAAADIAATEKVPSGPEQTSSVILVTPEKRLNLTVQLADTLEGWAKGARLLAEPGAENSGGVLLLFPTSRYTHFSASGITGGVDVVLVGESGNVVEVFRGLAGRKSYAVPEKLLAVLYLESGAAGIMGIDSGDLVVPDGFDFGAPGSPGDLSASFNEEFERMSDADDTSSIHKYCLARFHIEKGTYSAALELLNKAVGAKDIPQYRLYRIKVFMALGRMESAMEEFEYLLDRHPMHMETYDALGHAFVALGKPELFLSVLKGKALQTGLPPVTLELASLYIKLGHLSSAKKELDRLRTQKHGLDAGIRAGVARVHGDYLVRQGMYADAAREYRQFLKHFPYAPGAARLRIFISRHMKDSER